MLQEYKKKRNFEKTPEPAPKAQRATGQLKFVIQKHSASRLHYDLRLELDGVLKSWAVPKGPSLDPSVKRLAAMVEDHPLQYQSFEGNIPEGEYGAGEVIIWDRGTYVPDEKGVPIGGDLKGKQEQIRQGLEKGKISFTLEGQKLHGSFALVRLQKSPKNWLLIKHDDQFTSRTVDVLKDGSSAATGRTIEDLKKKAAPVYQPVKPGEVAGAVKSGFPAYFPPMLATLIPKPFSSPDWIFEPKLDGYRALAYIKDRKAKLISRNEVDFSPKFQVLIPGLEKAAGGDLVMDGEIVALEKDGRACFQCLQGYFKFRGAGGQASTPPALIVYYVFDILYFAGYDLRKVPLIQRKMLLEQTVNVSENIRLVEYFENEGEKTFENAVKLGFEGAIAKRKDSLYESGRRSNNWLKFKSTLSDDFFIGGYTRGGGVRNKTFGALLLGKPGGGKKLDFVGSVGTGFDDRQLAEFKSMLDQLETTRNPFADPIPLNNEMIWVKPTLVAEVKYAEQTRDGFLRAPVFLRLRDDQPAFEPGPETYPSGERVDLGTAETRPDADSGLAEILSNLRKAEGSLSLKVEGHEVSFSNLEKFLWPASSGGTGYTKKDLLLYLAQASPYMLPHLKNRPLTLRRYPGGIYDEHFFQKHWAFKVPEYVQTVSLSERGGARKEYLVCNNLATLLWLGQQANLEFHVWFSRLDEARKPGGAALAKSGDVDRLLDFPDFIIFDIDPYIYSGQEKKGQEPELNRAAFRKACEAAIWLKEALDGLSLSSFIKTSGMTGLHIFVPIVPEFDYESVRAAAKTVAEHLLARHPSELTVEWAVEKRAGKIFLDYNQNVRGKTLASAYSPRPAPKASVSTPLTWDEVGKVYPTEFTIASLPKRLEKVGDIWAPILENPGDLAKSLGLGRTSGRK